MAFFSGKNKNTTTNTSTTDISTDNSVTAGDNRVAGDNSLIAGNVTAQSIGTVTATDYGAIDQAMGLAKGSFDFASNTVANAFTLTDTATSNALLFGKSALESANDSLREAANVMLGSYDAITQNNANAFTFADAAMDKSLGTVQKSLDTVAGTVSSSTSGINNAINKIADVVKSANTSDSVQTIKYIAAAVIAIGVAYMFIKSQRGA